MIALSSTVFLLILALLFVLMSILLHRLISRQDNELDWIDLVATRGKLNANKIGYWIGASVGGWVVVKQTITNHLDAGVFAAWLAFLAGVYVANSYIGNRQVRQTGEFPPKPERQF